MGSIETVNEVKLDNLLYLTDFSEPAEAALPFVTSIAREYGSEIYACHILLPNIYASMAPEFGDVVSAGREQGAVAEMQSVESRLIGLPHKSQIERGSEVRATLQRIVEENNIDLVVLGTHGRRGVQKFLLGSVAEEIWRSASVPVLTIGPGVGRAHSDKGFHCVLFATDFTVGIIEGPNVCGIDGARISGAPCSLARYPTIQEGRNPGRAIRIGCDLLLGPTGTDGREAASPSGVGSEIRSACAKHHRYGQPMLCGLNRARDSQ